MHIVADVSDVHADAPALIVQPLDRERIVVISGILRIDCEGEQVAEVACGPRAPRSPDPRCRAPRPGR